MQRDTLFTQGVKAFLADLGIDYQKEADVSPVGVIQDGSMPYSGRFNLTGELAEAGEGLADVAGVQCFFRRNSSRETAAFGSNVIALEFMIRARWILDELPSICQ